MTTTPRGADGGVEGSSGLRERVTERVRASTMREVMRLRTRAGVVEEDLAENLAVRARTQELLARLEQDVAACERGLAHGAER